jgi:hypothetical protein
MGMSRTPRAAGPTRARRCGGSRNTTGRIQVHLNDQLALTVDDRGLATRHFKNGVYHHGSGRAEARFRDIHYWTR